MMSDTTSWESPEEDVAEQHTEVAPDVRPEAEREVPAGLPRLRWDVDPADAAEQEIEVPIDEDEWR